MPHCDRAMLERVYVERPLDCLEERREPKEVDSDRGQLRSSIGVLRQITAALMRTAVQMRTRSAGGVRLRDELLSAACRGERSRVWREQRRGVRLGRLDRPRDP